MTKSQSKGSGCFSGIARLLLCKRSLQTHPSDQVTEPTSSPVECDHVNKDSHIEVVINVEVDAPVASTAAPGVVARLMGLDSLPKTNWVLKGKPDSVTRSRSVNFMDYMLEFDLAEDEQQEHRRVRASVSFREVPTLSNHQRHNNDIFVLYPEDNAEKTGKKTGSKLRKSEVGVEEIVKQKKSEEDKNDNGVAEGGEVLTRVDKESDKQNEVPDYKQFSRFGSCKGAQASSGFLSPRNKKDRITNPKAKSPVKPTNQKEALVESKFMKKIKNQQAIKDAQSECSSEDSSPISVLDLDEFSPIHDEMSPLSDYSLIASSTRLSIDLEPKELKKIDYKRHQQSSRDSKYYTEVVKKLCKLTEEDIKETQWIAKDVSEYENVEEICSEVGQQILDALVKQVVKELVGFHLKSFIDGKVF